MYRGGSKIGHFVSEKTKKKLSISRKGKILSEEHKRRLSVSHLGYIMSEEHKRKISKSMKRKTHGFKKGVHPVNEFKIGHIPWNKGNCFTKRDRSSPHYKQWRRTVFIRDEFTCQECGKVHVYIEAHHIKPFSKFPELCFDINNGVTLCKDCHDRKRRKNANCC